MPAFTLAVDWTLFLSTFGLVFVAELPDKTAFATLLLSTSHHPVAVFVGASLAFVVQSIVAVAFGALFGLLPPRVVHVGAAGLFLVFAVLMWRRRPDEAEAEAAGQDAPPVPGRFWRSGATAFMVIFVAEWGDLTQLATATLVAKYQAQVLTIFLGATAALVAVTALATLIGHHAKRFIKPAVLQRVAAVAMAGAGLYLLLAGD